MSRYETKSVQPPADNVNKIATALDTTVDFLISGDQTEKAKAIIQNSELLQSFNEMDILPEQEQTMLVKIIRAYVRDFKARQTYAV
jgi:transcriptional regulator with XRE-family HTH domain